MTLPDPPAISSESSKPPKPAAPNGLLMPLVQTWLGAVRMPRERAVITFVGAVVVGAVLLAVGSALALVMRVAPAGADPEGDASADTGPVHGRRNASTNPVPVVAACFPDAGSWVHPRGVPDWNGKAHAFLAFFSRAMNVGYR